MINKRGQAAMEFLMTYGWALLVVLVAIGALAFFGVLNPGQFLPDTCTMPPGISCLESQAVDKGGANIDEVTIVTQNGFGENMVGTQWRLIVTNQAGVTCLPNNTAHGAPTDPFVSGTSATVIFQCGTGLTEGSNIKGDVYVNYSLSGSSFIHNKTGSIALKVEQA